MTDFRASLPPKMSQDRGGSAAHSYPKASTTRQGMHHQSTAPAAKNIDLQPSVPKRVDYPNQENGMQPAADLPSNPNDAQSVACDQPEIETPTEAKPAIETTAAPSGGGSSESIPHEADAATGGIESAEARYPQLTGDGHPSGYPST
jgi:hypothetical protein